MTEAKLTITHQGEQGDLPDPVDYDMTDEQVLAIATEALRAGGIPGLTAAPEADLAGYVIDRYTPKDDLGYRLSARPKVAFGWQMPHIVLHGRTRRVIDILREKWPGEWTYRPHDFWSWQHESGFAVRSAAMSSPRYDGDDDSFRVVYYSNDNKAVYL